MKKKIIGITIFILIAGAIGIVLANNKAKIDKRHTRKKSTS